MDVGFTRDESGPVVILHLYFKMRPIGMLFFWYLKKESGLNFKSDYRSPSNKLPLF